MPLNFTPLQNKSALFTLLLGLGLLLQSCSAGNNEPAPPTSGFTSGNIYTVAGLGPKDFGYNGDGGLAIGAQIDWITGIAVDVDDNLYLTGGASNTVREVTASDGIIHTIAGTFVGFNEVDATPFKGDGTLASGSHLNIPDAIAVDNNGNVIISDAGNNCIRIINKEDGIINTLVNIHRYYGYRGDGGPPAYANVFNPGGLAVNWAGNLYFADTENNTVRLVTPSNYTINTVAGLGPDNAGYSGDYGPARSAELNNPVGVALDADGNLYIADAGNNVIRKVTHDAGTITTFAGNGKVGYSGDGGLATEATFGSVRGIAVGPDGSVYVADGANNVIRKISEGRFITTYVGNGNAGYSGDEGPALQAELSGPLDVAVDQHGNLYIADSNNSAIRVVIR